MPIFVVTSAAFQSDQNKNKTLHNWMIGTYMSYYLQEEVFWQIRLEAREAHKICPFILIRLLPFT